MSGLLDAVILAMTQDTKTAAQARAAVEAVADWLGANMSGATAQIALRAEVAPPKPTPEDVIEKWLRGPAEGATPQWAEAIAAALRDAGMLREDTP